MQYSPGQRSKKKHIQARSLMDFFVDAALEGGVQGMQDVDGDGPKYLIRRVFLLVGSELLDKPKVCFPYSVVPWVVGPHGYK